MRIPNAWTRLMGAALLLTFAASVGCGGGHNPSGSTISPTWTTTSTAVTTPATLTAPLLWIDPNLGPTNTGGGGQGDKTFTSVDPSTWPPGSPNGDHPVVVGMAQNSNEEFSIEGQAFIYRSSLIAAGGGQNAAAVVVLPGLYGNQAKLSQVARAVCKHYLIHTPTEMSLFNLVQFSLAANKTAGVGDIYGNLPLPNIDAAAAWNIMQAQLRVQQGGYMGGGYWTTATLEVYALLFTNSVP